MTGRRQQVRYADEKRTLERFVAERGDRLLRTAALLTGSQADGEDLLQSALERLLRNWRRIDGDPEHYVRRTLYNLAADGWRRQRVWQRKAILLEPAPPVDPATAVDLRDAMLRVLAQLPPRQRAVLVLRYFEQLSEAETAEVLGCSVGTVKSAASRGLARLREMTAFAPGAEARTARESS
jgi:RNA polymerase sigma-70 factor (sigma-E family)